MKRQLAPLLGALGLLLLPACATTAFSPHFRDNNPDDLRAALSGLDGEQALAPFNATGKPLAVIVTAAPTKLLAYDLAGRKVAWQAKAEVSSRIVVGRERIYHLAPGAKLVARDIRNGNALWETELGAGDRLVGLAADDRDVFCVTENVKRRSDGTAAYLMAFEGASGKRRWLQRSAGQLGAPAAKQGKVFVPTRYQSLAVVDGATGAELARIRSKEETLLWVKRAGTGPILFGGKSGIYRLDAEAAAGSKRGSTFLAAALPKSVQPAYFWDGYNAALSDYTAYDRNRLLWQVGADAKKFLDNLFFVHNYRFFFAFESPTATSGDAAAPAGGEGGRLRWAYNFPRHDVVASIDTGAALVLVAANGQLVILDRAAGRALVEEKLGVKVRGVTFDAEGFAAPAAGARGDVDLRRTLTDIIWDPDRRFGAVKLFAVEQLARLDDPAVSEDLVKIVTQTQVDPAVYKLAGDALVARRDKASVPLFIETLSKRYSFLEGSRARATDILARAVGDLQVPEAVKPLIAHLADQETPLPAVEEVVRALVRIGDKSAVEPFRDYLLSYRCEPFFEKTPGALRLIVDGLLKMGGEDERQILRFVQNDSHTIGPLRTHIAEAFKQLEKRGQDNAAQKEAARPAPSGKTMEAPLPRTSAAGAGGRS